MQADFIYDLEGKLYLGEKMKKFIISILPAILLLPIIRYDKNLFSYLWFLPIPIIIAIYLTDTKKSEKFKKDEISILTICKANTINVIFFIIFFCFIYVIKDLFPSAYSYNVWILPMYFCLNLNYLWQSSGFKIMNIKVSNDNDLDKIKILINNFLIISPTYFVSLENNFLESSSKLTRFEEMLVLINILNFFTRIFILRENSLFEKILGIEYEALEKQQEKSTEIPEE